MQRLQRIQRHLGAVPAIPAAHEFAAGGGSGTAVGEAAAVVRVAVFGAGGHARRAHLPSLRVLPNVVVVAIADSNRELAQEMAHEFAPSARIYSDGHAMLDAEPDIDALFSVVPAFSRIDGVEKRAAERGIHIFSEKPQALTVGVCKGIADAVASTGVVSTVGFRERYRPLFQKARDFLADKEIIHMRFASYGGMPRLNAERPTNAEGDWHWDFDRAGGGMFDWGCHSLDYLRFMSGLEVVKAQSFYNHPAEYNTPLSASCNFQMSNGATMTSTFVNGASGQWPPAFTIQFVGGTLEVHMYSKLVVNGETYYDADANDPNQADAPADGYVNGEGYDPWLLLQLQLQSLTELAMHS